MHELIIGLPSTTLPVGISGSALCHGSGRDLIDGSPNNAALPSVGSVQYVRCGRTNPHWADINEKPKKKRNEDDLMLDGQSSIENQDRPYLQDFGASGQIRGYISGNIVIYWLKKFGVR